MSQITWERVKKSIQDNYDTDIERMALIKDRGCLFDLKMDTTSFTTFQRSNLFMLDVFPCMTSQQLIDKVIEKCKSKLPPRNYVGNGSVDFFDTIVTVGARFRRDDYGHDTELLEMSYDDFNDLLL